MLRRIEALTERLSRGLCLGGAAALGGLMVAVTVVDVTLRQLSTAVPGAFELVTLGMRILVPLAMPYAFWIGGHVAVELVVDRLPVRVRAGVVAAGLAVSGAVMAMLAWASSQRALNAWSRGDTTNDLGLPEILNWAPVVAGAALSVPVIAVLLAGRIAVAAGRRADPEPRRDPSQ
ncbi:MAG: TRAP transporter small permease [Rhodospirillaceae bacterium]|nr:TRAP transporter small permease [Rhodospirillaceae bacterium]